MAEIHVQTKKHSSPVWVWILLALIIVGALVYFLARNQNKDADRNTTQRTTSFVTPAVPTPSLIYEASLS
jgi:hypothetical protein